jgi:hypothetical protein
VDEGDFLVLYRDVVQRASELARQHSDLVDHPLSACPDWTGRQLLAHLMGVAQDLVAGRVDGYASHVWTSAQVARGEGLPLEVCSRLGMRLQQRSAAFLL